MMDRATSADRPAPPESARLSHPADVRVGVPSGLAALAHVDRRVWMCVGAIGIVGAAITTALARDLHRSAMVPAVILAATVFSVARAGWTWMRGHSRRARLGQGVLSRIESYGGGVYGTGAGITLLILSAASLREDWQRASGFADFLRGMTWEWWMGFSGESIRNAVLAGIWPIHWFSIHGLTAALAVGAAAWAGDAVADAWRRRNPLPAEEVAPAGGDADGRLDAA